MKKILKIIGIIILMGFSFFYTRKVVCIVNNYDDVMIKIKKINREYKKESTNAYIKNNTIIPGISGTEIDINKSYSKMKRYGKFNSSLLVFKIVKPKTSLNKNKDKYIISGNKNIRNISIIFILEDKDKIDKILSIVNKKNIKVNFFTNRKWLEKNIEIIPGLVKTGYNLGITDKNNWSSNIIKKIGKQKYEYCYTKNKNKQVLQMCKNKYIIMANIIEYNYYSNTIKQLENGKILVYKISKQLIRELPIIINYINSKDYNIVNLENLLKE